MRRRIAEKPVSYRHGSISFHTRMTAGEYDLVYADLVKAIPLQHYNIVKSNFIKGFNSRISFLESYLFMSYETREKMIKDLRNLEKEKLSRDKIDFLGVLKEMSAIEESYKIRT